MQNIPSRFGPAVILYFALVATSHAAAPAPAALKTFLEHQGYGGSSLQRRFGNHLFVNTVINGRRTALMIDSGCPITLIDRTSAKS
jgi:predicted aspartyl protease